MDFEAILSVLGAEQTYLLFVEPWGLQYDIHPADECALIASSPTDQPSFSVAPSDDQGLIVGVNSGNSTFKFYRNGVLEMDMPIATILFFGGS